MKNLTGKIVVLIGAAGLLGQKISALLAKSGAFVVLADINFQKASLISEFIAKSGGNSHPIIIDITSHESILNVINFTKEKYSKIDCVINLSYPKSSNYGASLEDVSYDDFCSDLNMHLGGYFLVTQKFTKFFIQNKIHGSIINFSSIYGTLLPDFDIYKNTNSTMPVQYAAIKSSIIQLSKYFSKFYLGSGVRFNTISPGGILDNQTKSLQQSYNKKCNIKGMLDPNDIYPIVELLCSDESMYITGQNFIIDDGFGL